jgi:hypothetical protein
MSDTLGYQDPQQARREMATDWRRRIFGVSLADAWNALAREIDARHEPRGWWRSPRVVADVGPWQLTLDTYQEGENQVGTRLRAPFVNPGGFRFRIYRKSIFSDLGKLLGVQDIVVGDPAFDEPFIVQSNDERSVLALLADPQLRRLIDAQPRIRFEVKDDEGWFGKQFPEQTDELQFLADSVIKDVDRLKLLFDLFAHTLQRLCELGKATRQPPGVDL